MGGCFSKNVAYDTLRSSIIGLLVPADSDFNEFFKMCRVETQRLTSNILNINQLQSFFIVVSGEVSVVLTPKDGKSVIVSTYKPGELIYFFHGNSISCSGGAITNKVLRLNLQFRSHDGLGQVIGMDRGSVDRFLDGRGHLRELHRLLDLQLTDFMDLPAFASISRDQLNILGPLMKLRITEQGDILKYSDEENLKLFTPKTVTSPSVSQHVKSMPPVAPHPVGILLCGTCFTLPLTVNIHHVLSEFYTLTIRSSGSGSGSGSGSHHAGRSSVYQTISNSPSPNNNTTTGSVYRRHTTSNHRVRNYEVLGLTESDPNISTLLQKLGTICGNLDIMQVFPGSIFGLDESFIKNFEDPHEIIVSTGRGLVAYIERETLKYLFLLDKRFKRVLQRNYTAAMLKTVRPHVPILQDMDNLAFDILAGVVTMKYLPRGDTLCKKGQASDFCYIVISGQLRDQIDDGQSIMIAESEQSSSNENMNMDLLIPHRDFPAGSLIGEVALITDSTYFSTVIVHEPATLICISKKSFERIYYGDKSKFAELNIRVAGKDVELTHILNHPLGNKLFFDFLKMEKAEENILFLNAVAKFDEMCQRFCKDLHATQLELASCEIGFSGTPVLNGSNKNSSNNNNKAKSPEANVSSTGNADNTTNTDTNHSTNLNSNGNNLQTIFSVDGLEDVTEHGSHEEMDVDDDERSDYDDDDGTHTPNRGGDDVSNAGDDDVFSSIPSERLLPQRIPSFNGSNGDGQKQQQMVQHEPSSPLHAAIIIRKTNSYSNLHENGASSAPNSFRRGNNTAANNNVRTMLNSTLVAESATDEEQEVLIPAPQRAYSHGSSVENINIKSPISRSFVSATGSEEESKKLLEAFGMQAVDKDDNNDETNNKTKKAVIETVIEASNTNEENEKRTASEDNKNPTTMTMITTMSQREMSGIIMRPPLLQVPNNNTFSSDDQNYNILTSMTNLSMEIDSVSRQNASVRQVYLRFENNIAELREVARNIIDKFVKPDVDQQVNLPEAMMKEVLKLFAKWTEKSDSEVLQLVQESMRKDSVAALHSIASPGKKSATHRKQHQLLTPSRSMRNFSSNEGAEFLHLFHDSVAEITKLVKSGPFHRWKFTSAFETFVSSIKPYDTNHNASTAAITRHHINPDEMSSISNNSASVVKGTPVSGNRARLMAQQQQQSSNASFNLYVIASRRYSYGLQGGSGSEHSKQGSPAMSNRVYSKPQPSTAAVSLLNAAAPPQAVAASTQATRKHNTVGVSG